MWVERTDAEATAEFLNLIYNRLDEQAFKAALTPDQMNELAHMRDLWQNLVDNSTD